MSRALVDRPSGRGLREWGLGWRAGFRTPWQSWSYRWGRDGAQRGRVTEVGTAAILGAKRAEGM